MKIEPAGHRIKIKPDPLEEVSAGGIVIAHGADKARKEQAVHTGILAAIGFNAWKSFDGGEPWAKVGDRVYFAKFGGHIVEENGETYRIMNDEDVTAIIREGAE